MENNKCLVLISGGIDSAVALFWAKYSGMVCEGLTFMYNNQAKAEKKAIQYICKNSNTQLNYVKHPLVGENKKNLKDIFYPDNLLYYSIAISFARQKEVKYIIGGQNKDDFQESKDAQTKFYENFNSILRTCYKNNIKIVQPLINMTKEEVVKLGIKLKVPLEHTWSCQNKVSKPCNTCSSCITRSEISKKLNIRI